MDVEDEDEAIEEQQSEADDEAIESGDGHAIQDTIATSAYSTCSFGAIYGDCTCSYSGSGGRGNVIEDDDIRGLHYELYSKWGSRLTEVQGRVRCTRGSDTYLKYGSWVTGRSQTSCPSGYTASNSRCRVRVLH